MKIVLDFDVIHEGIMMKMFVCTLEYKVEQLFEFCSLEEIFSFVGLNEAFCKHGDSSYEEEK